MINSLKNLWGSVLLCIVTPVASLAAPGEPPEPPPEIRQLFDVRTVMRDGVELSSDVWLPRKPGQYPVILLRTPYIKAMPVADFAGLGSYFARHGYAFVVQDVRGRGDSDGEFNFFFQEADDGYDSISALAEEPWANGRVCMMGVSYWATVQWLAAREQPENLACIAPTSPAGEYVNELPYVGGAFMMAWALNWLNDTSGNISQGPNAASLDWEHIFSHRPLLTMDEAMGRKMRLYREFLQHPTLDDYWGQIKLEREDFERIDLPVLAVTGWFDGDQTGTLYYWRGMARHSPAADQQYLVIGPWTHIQSFLGGETAVGEMQFGEDSIIDNRELHLRFFDRYLKQSGKLDLPRVQLYVTGENRWRTYDRYPPADVETRPLYLSSDGGANTRHGDGELVAGAPPEQQSDRFRYDPKNPVPLDISAPFAAADRRDIEERDDVLVYTGPELDASLDVIGPIEVELFAATDGRDTDFTATVLDVYPDGRAVALGPKTVGIIRARYRHGLDQTRLLEPGAVERYRIELGDIAHRFLPGHRVRLEISSSAAPMYNPNQNTGNPVATDTQWRSARQTIHHGSEYPSALLLPVVQP